MSSKCWPSVLQSWCWEIHGRKEVLWMFSNFSQVLRLFQLSQIDNQMGNHTQLESILSLHWIMTQRHGTYWFNNCNSTILSCQTGFGQHLPACVVCPAGAAMELWPWKNTLWESVSVLINSLWSSHRSAFVLLIWSCSFVRLQRLLM